MKKCELLFGILFYMTVGHRKMELLTWRWGPGPDSGLYCPAPVCPGLGGPCGPGGPRSPYIGDGRP